MKLELKIEFSGVLLGFFENIVLTELTQSIVFVITKGPEVLHYFTH